MAKKILAVQEADLRMSGNLAMNIKRVLPVTQADIDAAAALGKGWTVRKVIEVSAPIDNTDSSVMRVIKQNSISAGQNVMRVMIVTSPSGQVVTVGPDGSPLSLPNALAESITSLIAFGGTAQRNLPAGYTQRNFIYMMDGSYLLTDLVPTYDCKIEMDFETTSLPAGNGVFFGTRTNTSDGSGVNLAFTAAKSIVIDTFGHRKTSSNVFTANTRYKYTYANSTSTLTSGGTTVETDASGGTDVITVPLIINAMNNNGTVYGNLAGIYLYSFKMWDNQGNLIADYVPCAQLHPLTVGFYDMVTGTFMTATAGTFAAGTEAVPTPDAPMDIVCNNGVLKARHQSGLPLGYTLLDYIRSDGSAYGYINTAYVPTADTRIEVEVVADAGAGNTNIFGSGVGSDGASQNALLTFNTFSNTEYEVRFVSGSQMWETFSGYDTTTRHTASLSVTQCKIDGVVALTSSLPFPSGTIKPIWLFQRWRPTVTSTNSQIKVYRFSIYENDVLVRNWIPVKNSSNVVGMYDTVREEFITSATAGHLTAGNAVSDPVEIYTDGTVETIGIHGGNNLCNNIFEQGSITSSGASSGSDTNRIRLKNYLSLPAGTYTISCDNAYEMYLYRTGASASWLQTSTFTFNSSGQVRFAVRNKATPSADISPTEPVNVMLNSGGSAQTYEPYFTGNLATCEDLLSIGTYTDEQEIISGGVTRKVGVKVLDGTENWISGGGGTGVWANFQSITGVAFDTTNAFCSHSVYGGANVNIVNMNQNEFCLYDNGNISFKNANTTSTSDWETFLAQQYANGTPVIVVYQLATSTTETVIGQPMNTVQGDNTAEITQASLEDLQLQVSYTKSV